MDPDATPPCANCQRLQAQLDASQARFDAPLEAVAPLQRQLAAARKDPSNSSKPPFRAGLSAPSKIDPTRSGDVLIEVLGTGSDGVLGCDDFSAYRRYQRELGVVLRFCLAHLIRDVK